MKSFLVRGHVTTLIQHMALKAEKLKLSLLERNIFHSPLLFCVSSPSVFLPTWRLNKSVGIVVGIHSPSENGFMEPKYLPEEVIIHPNHHLTFGDWIPRDILILSDSSSAFCFASQDSFHRLHWFIRFHCTTGALYSTLAY